MANISKLEKLIRALYEEKQADRAVWADWLYANHVFVVADNAERLAEKYGADIDEARAAAVLHDIADATTGRFDPRHEEKSAEIARDLLQKSDFTNEQIELIVEDALRFHSCHNGEQPSSLVGQILATADSYAHLRSSFYLYATHQHTKNGKPYKEIIAWLSAKLDRDYNNKILFEDEKADLTPDYKFWKGVISV